MADRIVQPKVLASTNPDTYDNLIMQQAQNATNVTNSINGNAISDIFENDGTTVKNATNAVVNSNGGFSSLTLDSNGILKIGNIIIPQKQLLWTGQTTSDLNLSQYGLNVGDIIEIEYCLYNSTTQEAVDQSNSFLKIRIKGDSDDPGIGPSIQGGYFNWSSLAGTTGGNFVLYGFSPTLNSSSPTLSISLNSSTFNVLYNMTFTNGQLTSIEPSSTNYVWQLLNVWKVIE